MWKKKENRKENRKENTACDMIYLAACVLKGRKPDILRVKGMDFEKLYHMSKFHSMTALVYEGLQSVLCKEDFSENPNLWVKFKNEKERSVRKNLLFDTERAKLLAFMEEKGIWYMPLKGIILKDMYPKMGLRQMADNDILFDESFQKEVCAWFEAQGYEAVSVGEENHDIYQKKPVYNFEMHTALYEIKYKAELAHYYEDVKSRLKKDAGNRFGYHFSDEDFYIYIMTHGFKHYSGGGSGFRFLTDLCVLLEKKQTELDWQYVQEELEMLGIAEFERNCRTLTEKLFNVEEEVSLGKLASNHKKLFLYFLSSGTYGTEEHKSKHRFENRMERKLQEYRQESGKNNVNNYYLSRLFPNQEFMMIDYPKIAKYKCLVPIAWTLRIVKMLCNNRERIWKEMKALWKAGRNKKQQR